MSSDIIDVGMPGKLGDIIRAFEIEKDRLHLRYSRCGYGPRIIRVDLIFHPIEPDDKAVFEVDVLQNNVTRTAKLRFEITEKSRNSIEQYRGKRDLSLMVIFIRIRDGLGQIIHRLSKRIGLIISDMRRAYDFWRRTGHEEPISNDFVRKWRRKRRHWCHRQSFMPTPHGAW